MCRRSRDASDCRSICVREFARRDVALPSYRGLPHSRPRMGFFDPTTLRSKLARVATVAVLLLGIRFSSSAALAAVNLPPEAVPVIANVLQVYDVVLSAVLLLAFLLAAKSADPLAKDRRTVVLLGFQGSIFLLWLYSLDWGSPPLAKDLYAALAAVAVVAASVVSMRVSRGRPPSKGGWGRWAHLTFLLAVPAVFLMRVAAAYGVGTAAGPSGTVEGDWFLVNAPTIVLELLAIGVWANLILDTGPSQLRARWHALLPFAAVPIFLIGFTLSPFSGYILSALITWGSNLALFTPSLLSVALAVAAISCYLSVFLLLGRKGNEPRWDLLLLGTATTVLAGFYLSMVSVAGLSVGMIVTAMASSDRGRRP